MHELNKRFNNRCLEILDFDYSRLRFFAVWRREHALKHVGMCDQNHLRDLKFAVFHFDCNKIAESILIRVPKFAAKTSFRIERALVDYFAANNRRVIFEEISLRNNAITVRNIAESVMIAVFDEFERVS
jgi:hypothetical protein